MTAPLRLTIAWQSTIGQRRGINEDAVLARQPVFLVADGMGGHQAGQRAARIAVEEFAKLAAPLRVEDVREALAQARSAIDQLGTPGGAGAAGTTVAGVVLVEQAGRPYWLVLNLGDSRTYHVLDGVVNQVSIDHSETQELVEAGRIDRARARLHPRRNVITRVLGAHTVERPDYWLRPVTTPERWMVCSDGLTVELDEQRIHDILTDVAVPQAAVEALVSAALRAGGRDNISVIIIDAEGADFDDVTLGDQPGRDTWGTKEARV